MASIKKILGSCPWLYKVLAAGYRHTVAPIRSGHMQHYICFLLRVYRKERAKLKTYGLEAAVPYDYRSWRIGKGKDGAVRRYYMAKYRGEKCFVKIGIQDATVANEQYILSALEGEAFSFSPRYIVGDGSFGQGVAMLAVAYIEDLAPFAIPKKPEDMENICHQFNEILDALARNRAVHADVHKGNLMLAKDKLYLLDYGISMIKGLPNHVDYVARPGTFYITGDTGRIYDDAYSFVQMLAHMGIEESMTNGTEYRRIAERIGENTLEIQC